MQVFSNFTELLALFGLRMDPKNNHESYPRGDQKSADPSRRVGVDVAKKLVTPINLAVATPETINLWGPRQRNFSAPGRREEGGGVVPLAGNRYRIQVQFASSKL